MKILAIRIKNLASLDGSTEIDFTGEPLCSAGIFAITGPTGAGKSTILDALCLALYGKTPRYLQAKESGIEITDLQGSAISQGDVRGILRDGSGDGFAEVDFVAVDGQRYRATWRVRRARDKAEGSLQQYTIALKNIDTNTDIPGKKNEVLEEIERLVGLNFEQFTRSVLLAQGDFTAFLKAAKDEKSSLLEKLTGTQIYSEISVRVFENHREQALQLRELNAKREGIPTKTSEELDALHAEQSLLEAGIKTQEDLVSDLAKEIHWHEQLATLQAGAEAARLENEEAVTAKLNAQPREQLLQQIIRVQPIRTTIDNLHNTQEQTEVKLNQSEQLKSELTILHQQKNTLDIAIFEAEQKLYKSIEEQESAQPLLDDAKKLDVQLAEKKKQVDNANKELITSIDKQQQHKNQFEKAEQEATQLNENVLRLSQWKDKNEVHRLLAEQADLVLSKLSDAKITLESIEYHTSVIDDAGKHLEVNQKEKERLQNEQSSIQTFLEKEQANYKAFQEAVTAIPIAAIEEEKIAIDISVEDIIHAEAHWKLLYGTLNERDNLLQALEQNTKDLSASTEQLSSVIKQVEAAKIEKETASKMLETARLSVSENVEKLRRQLEPGAPCPVCGSTEHPYAEHNPQLHNVFTEMEAEYQQIENSYSEYLGEQARLNQLCSHLHKTTEEQQKDIKEKEEAINQLEQTWSGFDIYTSCMEQPVNERTKWLQQQLQFQKNKQQQLQEQIKSHDKQKKQMDTCKDQLSALEKKSSDAVNGIKDIERLLKSLHEKRESSSSEKLKIADKLEKIRQELSPYFNAEQWFENWQKDAETFVNHINTFAGQWRNNIKKLDDSIKQQGVLTATVKGLEEQSKNHSDAVQQQEQNIIQLKIQWQDFSDKRKAIYNGEAVSIVEARLKEAVNQSRKIFEDKKKEKDALQAGITSKTALVEQLEKETGQLSKQEIALENKIQDWLNNYNQAYDVSLTKDALIQLLDYTQEWIETERTALYKIDNAVTKTKSVLDERANALNKHQQQRISEKAFEELVVLQTEAKALQQEKQRAATEIAFQLKQDETNKQRIGNLLQSIEKQAVVTDDWAKLNDIIGSADGKKFRQIAQEYTLDVLLMYANVHLQVLSKRYMLQRIPGSLGLQVVDQDMGDEIRTVFSLSGGESFLVSLALALGLASLSSSRMKVESLFIDEGFGALDPATLNIAMDALERLHNQGRKVGVISHVQEMTERIPVQIKVSKQQSGRSKVEVVGV